MPTPNAPHRSKQTDFRSRPPRSYFVVLLALVVGLMAYAGGAAGVSHVRDAAVGDDTLRPTMPRRLRLAGATSTTLMLSWNPSRDNVGVKATTSTSSAGRPSRRHRRRTGSRRSLAGRPTEWRSPRTTPRATDRAERGFRSRLAHAPRHRRRSPHRRRLCRHQHRRHRHRRQTPNRRPSRSFLWGQPHKQRLNCGGSRARTTSECITTTSSGEARRPAAAR